MINYNIYSIIYKLYLQKPRTNFLQTQILDKLEDNFGTIFYIKGLRKANCSNL